MYHSIQSASIIFSFASFARFANRRSSFNNAFYKTLIYPQFMCA